MKHKHAELMMQYAQDAMETNTPLELWELYYINGDKWVDCTSSPAWYDHIEYRRKPKMISVTLMNGEVASWPEPHKCDLNYNDAYFISDESGGVTSYDFQNTSIERKIIAFGLAHLTKEAAEKHSHALFKINNQVAK